MDRDGFRCTKCGKASALEAHHVVRLERGGDPYALANLLTLCTRCHIAIHKPPVSAEVQEWRDFLADLVNSESAKPT